MMSQEVQERYRRMLDARKPLKKVFGKLAAQGKAALLPLLGGDGVASRKNSCSCFLFLVHAAIVACRAVWRRLRIDSTFM